MKTRKISKQSLVIAVLSLLLVLSMGLYATGAYFTDKTAGNVGTGTLTFGTVKVDATYAQTSSTVSYAEAYIVPGDSYAFAGTLTPAGTVEMLVAVQFTYSLQITGKPMTVGENVTLGASTVYDVDDLYNGTTGTANKAMEATAATFAAAAGWTEITGASLTAYGLAEGVRLFKVLGNADGTQATTPASAINYSCSFSLDDDNCGNIVHGDASVGGATAADKVFVLNYNQHDTYATGYVVAETIVLTAAIKVGAIQSRVGANDFTAATAGTELTALLA